VSIGYKYFEIISHAKYLTEYEKIHIIFNVAANRADIHEPARPEFSIHVVFKRYFMRRTVSTPVDNL